MVRVQKAKQTPANTSRTMGWDRAPFVASPVSREARAKAGRTDGWDSPWPTFSPLTKISREVQEAYERRFGPISNAEHSAGVHPLFLRVAPMLSRDAGRSGSR